jgi:protein LTV1
MQETEKHERTEQIEVEVKSKKAKWDCESITSTYSNIYNHPTIISEPPKRKAHLIKQSKVVGGNFDVSRFL